MNGYWKVEIGEWSIGTLKTDKSFNAWGSQDAYAGGSQGAAEKEIVGLEH